MNHHFYRIKKLVHGKIEKEMCETFDKESAHLICLLLNENEEEILSRIQGRTSGEIKYEIEEDSHDGE